MHIPPKTKIKYYRQNKISLPFSRNRHKNPHITPCDLNMLRFMINFNSCFMMCGAHLKM